MIYKALALILVRLCAIIYLKKWYYAKNYLLIYSEQLATDIELLCQNINIDEETFKNIATFAVALDEWLFQIIKH